MVKNSFQKRSVVVLTALSLFTLLLVSCKKDKTTVPAQTTTSSSYADQVTGKWKVGDGSARIAANTSGYSSFEFTSSGSFIITKSDSTCVTGFYTIDASNSKITLGTYGVITITKVDGTVLDFTLRLTGSSTDITIFSSKTGTVISTSSRTDSLCHKWAFVTEFQDGVEATALKDSIATGIIKATVIISSVGTYLTIVERKGVATQTQYGNGSWSWTDDTQTAIKTGPGATNTGKVTFVNGKFYVTAVSPSPNSHTFEDIFQKVQ